MLDFMIMAFAIVIASLYYVITLYYIFIFKVV